MASLSSPCIAGTKSSFTFSSSSPFPKPSQLSLHSAKRNHHHFKVTCTAADGGESQPKLDRRDVILGLGGLYGAASLVTTPLAAVADPIQAPEVSKCVVPPADLPPNALVDNCCPPWPPTAYAAKFEKAIALMKALPADDPRNFYQQANVHCAYCNGGYVQVRFPNKEIHVHHSWLFFRFHRWYLYFYERIMGKLIGDPTFALPFWNWDTQEGMLIPSIFTNNPNSSLYNENRNQSHLPPTVVDLGYDGKDTPATDEDRISNNLFLVYKNMVSNAGTAEMFHGKPYRAGDAPNSDKEGMGPARRRRQGAEEGERFPDSDWLDSTFIFYDENAQAVRVRVGDALDNQKLGYKYEFTKLPWLDSKPKPVPATKRGLAARSTAPFVTSVFPVTLDKVVQVKVARPRKSRSKEEKEAEEEILLIEGIEVAMDEYAKFDVYLNDEDEPGAGKLKAEYAGSFASLPHKRKGSKKIRASLSLGLNEPLEDLGAEDDDAVLVTLAPKVGGGGRHC
nr:polyphenol oxidase I, chloroplastic-like [Ipomoea batatas]